MTIYLDPFVVGINYKNEAFTPKQIAEYIRNTSDEGFADRNKLKYLIDNSISEFDKLIKKYQCDMDRQLKASSEEGKNLAALALQHCNETIELIVEGGARRGILI